MQKHGLLLNIITLRYCEYNERDHRGQFEFGVLTLVPDLRRTRRRVHHNNQCHQTGVMPHSGLIFSCVDVALMALHTTQMSQGINRCKLQPQQDVDINFCSFSWFLLSREIHDRIPLSFS